jgi:hypothetical protein
MATLEMTGFFSDDFDGANSITRLAATSGIVVVCASAGLMSVATASQRKPNVSGRKYFRMFTT